MGGKHFSAYEEKNFTGLDIPSPPPPFFFVHSFRSKKTIQQLTPIMLHNVSRTFHLQKANYLNFVNTQSYPKGLSISCYESNHLYSTARKCRKILQSQPIVFVHIICTTHKIHNSSGQLGFLNTENISVQCTILPVSIIWTEFQSVQLVSPSLTPLRGRFLCSAVVSDETASNHIDVDTVQRSLSGSCRLYPISQALTLHNLFWVHEFLGLLGML